MTDTTGGDREDWADDPILDIRPLSDVVPLDGVDIVDVWPSGQDGPDRPDRPDGHDGSPDDDERPPRIPVGRPVVGSTLTAVGVVGTVVAGALPWSGGRGLSGVRALATGQSWVVWLLLSVAAAVVFGVVALLRPGRRVRWWGAGFALAGTAFSGWTIGGLPADQQVGPGPGLATVALAVLTSGQILAALASAEQPAWRWRPAAVAAAAVAALLVAAGLGSAGIAGATNVDATMAHGPLPPVTGVAPATVDRELWTTTGRVYGVAGSVALVVSGTEHGAVELAGVRVLDLRTGVERWHHYERGWKVREAALTQDGSIAFAVVDAGAETDAVGLDVASGRVLWRQRLGSSINCVTPRADQVLPVGACLGQFVTGDGLMILGVTTGDGVTPVTYLSARDGHEWPVRLAPGCRVRAAGGDAHGVYVLDQCVSPGFPDPHLISETVLGYSLDGTRRWSTPLDLVRGTVAGAYGPMIVAGNVVLAQQEQRYVALNAGDGTQLWTTTDAFEPETVVTDGSLLAWSTGVQAVMLDLHSGTTLWQQDWQFPQEADLPLLDAGRLYLIQHTIGPNPYTCAEQATLLTLDPDTGHHTGNRILPNGVGNDCGPDVQDRSYLRGPLLVLVTGATIAVLAGH